jgi:hypothetical protein
LPNVKDSSHDEIVIVATMTWAALSNAQWMLSNKIQEAFLFPGLIQFAQVELEVLTGAILAELSKSRWTLTLWARY